MINIKKLLELVKLFILIAFLIGFTFISYFFIINLSEPIEPLGFHESDQCYIPALYLTEWTYFHRFGFEVLIDHRFGSEALIAADPCGLMGIRPLHNNSANINLNEENLPAFVELIIHFKKYPTHGTSFTAENIYPILEELNLLDYYFDLITIRE